MSSQLNYDRIYSDMHLKRNKGTLLAIVKLQIGNGHSEVLHVN